MEELDYGPNGGLVYCFEYLCENLDWLQDQLGDGDDDYFIIDCPGQMELYSHVPVMRDIVQALQRWGFMVCGVYVLDSQFMADPGKFISGCLACLSAMVQLEIPHVNVMTKMDLVRKKRSFMERFYNPDMVRNLQDSARPRRASLHNAMFSLPCLSSLVPAAEHSSHHLQRDALAPVLSQDELVAELNQDSNPRFFKLNEALGSLIEDYSLVGFVPLCAMPARPLRHCARDPARPRDQ